MKTMWKYLLLFSTANIAMQGIVQAQTNLVPNPSFEMHTSCPDNTAEINYLSDWKIYMNTPDFFSSCATVAYMGVPNNFAGYQQANSGNSYIGLYCYETNASPYYREIAGVQLISPLILGQKYYITFHANLSLEYINIGVNAAVKTLGIRFTNTDYSISQNPPINNFAHLVSSNFISDTLNWTTVSGSFIADSTYKYLMIGNFFDDANTPLMKFSNTPDSNSYYFIDNICVSTDSLKCNGTVGINKLDITPFIHIYPNPAKNYINIDIPYSEESYDLNIYNALGQELFIKQKIPKHSTIDLANFPDGILFIKISSNNQLFYYKLIKQ